MAISSVVEYKKQKRDYKKYLSEEAYSHLCDFLNWGRDRDYTNTPKDPNGIVTSTGVQRYNPCTIAQQTLTTYGQYLQGKATKHAFLHQADFLISMIERDGSLRYYFDFSYYCMPDKYFKAGWCSSMDNGHVLSICARAYSLTHDEIYAEAALKNLKFLQTTIEEDGVKSDLRYLDPSLSGYITFEEYPTIPSTYTLNGFMYTLIGIYDWSCIDSPSKDIAKEMFNSGVKTLKSILPYFDIGGFTAYDLSHLTVWNAAPHIGVGYHCEHTAFCKIFYDITGIEDFNYYYKLWSSYVE